MNIKGLGTFTLFVKLYLLLIGFFVKKIRSIFFAVKKTPPLILNGNFPGDLYDKESPAVQETWVQSLDQEDPLKKKMAAHSNILAWRIPWKEEPGGLQSMGSQSQT